MACVSCSPFNRAWNTPPPKVTGGWNFSGESTAHPIHRHDPSHDAATVSLSINPPIQYHSIVNFPESHIAVQQDCLPVHLPPAVTVTPPHDCPCWNMTEKGENTPATQQERRGATEMLKIKIYQNRKEPFYDRFFLAKNSSPCKMPDCWEGLKTKGTPENKPKSYSYWSSFPSEPSASSNPVDCWNIPKSKTGEKEKFNFKPRYDRWSKHFDYNCMPNFGWPNLNYQLNCPWWLSDHPTLRLPCRLCSVRMPTTDPLPKNNPHWSASVPEEVPEDPDDENRLRNPPLAWSARSTKSDRNNRSSNSPKSASGGKSPTGSASCRNPCFSPKKRRNSK